MKSRQPLPHSPLFPYTTLFRSKLVATSPERRARHRATGPARTPIHDIAQSVSTNAAPIGRGAVITAISTGMLASVAVPARSEEHTSELQSRGHLVCRLLLAKKK